MKTSSAVSQAAWVSGCEGERMWQNTCKSATLISLSAGATMSALSFGGDKVFIVPIATQTTYLIDHGFIE